LSLVPKAGSTEKRSITEQKNLDSLNGVEFLLSKNGGWRVTSTNSRKMSNL